jgi:hypothetical protein
MERTRYRFDNNLQAKVIFGVQLDTQLNNAPKSE